MILEEILVEEREPEKPLPQKMTNRFARSDDASWAQDIRAIDKMMEEEEVIKQSTAKIFQKKYDMMKKYLPRYF